MTSISFPHQYRIEFGVKVNACQQHRPEISRGGARETRGFRENSSACFGLQYRYVALLPELCENVTKVTSAP